MKLTFYFAAGFSLLTQIVHASLLPHNDVSTHHSDGLHFGHSSSIVIDNGDNHALDNHNNLIEYSEVHPVYHHTGIHHRTVNHIDDAVIQHDDNHSHHEVEQPATKVIHHEPIHHVAPVHHVTKIVHHEPHHFFHYTKPLVDHHVIHKDDHHYRHHGDHVEPLLHHHHSAESFHTHNHHDHVALVEHNKVYPHYHNHPAAIVHRVHPDIAHFHTAANVLAFTKHQLHGHYGKVRITEKHY